MLNSKNENHFKSMADKWPSAFVAREKVGIFSGGIVSPGTLANLKCQGGGPEYVTIGRKICYPLGPLIEWLKSRVK